MKATAEVRWELLLDPEEQWRGVKSGVEFYIDRITAPAGMPAHVEVSGFLVKSDGTMGKARRSLTVPFPDEGGFPDDGRVHAEVARIRTESTAAVATITGGAA